MALPRTTSNTLSLLSALTGPCPASRPSLCKPRRWAVGTCARWVRGIWGHTSPTAPGLVGAGPHSCPAPLPHYLEPGDPAALAPTPRFIHQEVPPAGSPCKTRPHSDHYVPPPLTPPWSQLPAVFHVPAVSPPLLEPQAHSCCQASGRRAATATPSKSSPSPSLLCPNAPRRHWE